MADKVFRIVSGLPGQVELEVNELLEHYAPMSWTVAVAQDRVVVTCILVSEREIQKAQFRAAQLNRPLPRM